MPVSEVQDYDKNEEVIHPETTFGAVMIALLTISSSVVAAVCFLIDHFHQWDNVHALLKL